MTRIGIVAFELEKTNTRAGIARMLFELLKYISSVKDIEKRFKFVLYFRASIPNIEFLNHPVFEKKVLKFIKPSFLIYFNFLIPYIGIKDKIDVMFFTTFMLPLLYFKKSIVIIHDTIFKAHPEWFDLFHRIAYRVLIDHAARKASKILTLTKAAKKDIIKYYKVEPERIVITSPGLDFKPVNDENLIKKVKEKYNIKKDFIFYTGQMVIRRRVRESILAFDKIANQFPDLQFLISHRDVNNQNIDELIKEINKKGERIIRIKFINEQDLPVLYSAAKVFIYASEYEGFGLPPAEATMCGTPSITGANQAALEIFGENGAFFVKDSKDINQIAEQMIESLTNIEKAKQIAKNGRESLKKYTWLDHGKKVLDVFKKY